MTKRFCDICEQPSEQLLDEQGIRTINYTTGNVLRPVSIRATVNFLNSAGLTPDLCPACAGNLAEHLANQLRAVCKGSTT